MRSEASFPSVDRLHHRQVRLERLQNCWRQADCLSDRVKEEQFHCFDDVTVSGSPIIRVLSVSGLGTEKNPFSDPKITF
jgi:hypothetical protein